MIGCGHSGTGRRSPPDMVGRGSTAPVGARRPAPRSAEIPQSSSAVPCDRTGEARLVGRRRGWGYVRGAHRVSARVATRRDSQQLENGGRIFGCQRARGRRSGKRCPGQPSFCGRCHRSDISPTRRPSPRCLGGRQQRRQRCRCGSNHEGSRRLDRYCLRSSPTHQRKQLPCLLRSVPQRRSRYKPRVETMLPLPMMAILTIGRVTFQRQVASTLGSCSETQEGFRPLGEPPSPEQPQAKQGVPLLGGDDEH